MAFFLYWNEPYVLIGYNETLSITLYQCDVDIVWGQTPRLKVRYFSAASKSFSWC